MYFEVEHRRTTGLRVISSLDVQRLTRLEGYNGIGKSALVRLIQVCVGRHPYPSDPTLWDSFREGVGQAKVVLHDLQDAGTIEWALDATQWRSKGDQVADVGQITIDGRAASLTNVQDLLVVHTILGNENLTGTLRRQLGLHSAAMREAAAQDSILQQRLTAMDTVLERLGSALDRAVGHEWPQAANREDQSRRELDAANNALVDAEDRVKALASALTLIKQLADLQDSGGDLDARIDESTERLAEFEGQMRDLDIGLAAISKGTAVSQAAQRELMNARRHADRTEIRLNESLVQVSSLAATAGIPSPTAGAITEQQRLSQYDLEKATADLAVIHTAPEVADIADDLAARLHEAEAAGLSAEIIVHDETMDAAYTVSQLRTVLTDHSRQLRALPPPQATEDLQASIKHHGQLVSVLRQLKSALETQQDAEQKARKARTRLQTAGRAVTEASVDTTLAALMKRRQDLTTQIRDTAVEKAELVRARAALGGGASTEEMIHRLETLLQQTGLLREQLPEAYKAAVSYRQETTDRVRAAAAEHRAATTAMRQARQGLGDVVALLVHEDTFAWVRAAAGHLIPDPDSHPNLQARDLQQLSEAVEGMRNRIASLRQHMTKVFTALDVARNELGAAAGDTSGLVSAVRSWFSNEVSEWFNQPQLLDTVFEGGTDVRVNLNDMSVRWQINDSTIARPLEAFSSGERAFAYTRAQLALLDGRPAPPNRLLVLDEFGAFIAREWQDRLESYLKDHAQRHPSDSTLLVLPLTRTLAELRDSGRNADEVAQLEASSYFVRTLLATGQ